MAPTRIDASVCPCPAEATHFSTLASTLASESLRNSAFYFLITLLMTDRPDQTLVSDFKRLRTWEALGGLGRRFSKSDGAISVSI